MPSSTRQTASNAVKGVRKLQTSVLDRRCDDLLLIKSGEALVRSSEALSEGVVRLEDALTMSIVERTRNAIAELGTLVLHGDAFGVEQIKDDVGRLICTRQIPSAYLVHLLAAAITGTEQGLRALLLGAATTGVERPQVPPKPAKRRSADRPSSTQATTPVAPATTPPIPDTGADLLGRLPPASANVSGPSSGRVEIRPDTERI